jgi:glycosyltransferase involved in cell wall biosynthesis
MEVLIITASLNEQSGWGRYSNAVINQINEQGMNVTICSETNEVEARYSMHYISRLASLADFLRNIIIVRNAAKKADIVHALDGWPYGVYGWLAVLASSKRFFINGVGTYSVAPLYGRMKGWLMRRAYGRAQKIFCISDYTSHELAAAGVSDKKLLTVLQGSSHLPEISEEEIAEYRTRYRISEDHKPLVLTVGAIKDRKGQIETLKAVEILKDRYPNILYVALGSVASNYADGLRSYASTHHLNDNLIIVDDADDRILSFFYSICDVFALNSNTDKLHHHFEGFGLVIVEAYQFGKPAVGSKDCGIESAIQDGVTGLLTEQRNPDDIAQKIAMIMEGYDVFANNARLAYKTFNWEKTVATYMEFYTD